MSLTIDLTSVMITYYISTWTYGNPLLFLPFAHGYSQDIIMRINLNYYNISGIDTLTFISLATIWGCILIHINDFHNTYK